MNIHPKSSLINISPLQSRWRSYHPQFTPLRAATVFTRAVCWVPPYYLQCSLLQPSPVLHSRGFSQTQRHSLWSMRRPAPQPRRYSAVFLHRHIHAAALNTCRGKTVNMGCSEQIGEKRFRRSDELSILQRE